MKSFALIPLLAAGTLSAAHADTYFDEAQVRSVQPQYESIAVPHQECTNEVVNEVQTVAPSRDYTGAVIGGVAGALLGNQVGRGHGREAATAAGAVVGALTGDNLSNQNRVAQVQEVPRQVTTCRTVNDVQNRISGYRVIYHYRGQSFTTTLPQQPGPTLRVRVSVDPA